MLSHGWKEELYETLSGVSTWFRNLRARALSAVRGIRSIGLGKLRWLAYPLVCATVITAALVAAGFYHVYFDRTSLPDMEAFARFEFPAIGCVYDADGRPLIELAREYRRITKYEDLPPIVRDAILATEDKNFFSHSGVDYSTIPRVLSKVRFRALVSHLTHSAGHKEVTSGGIFPQGGSTITQQLVRGHFSSKADGSGKQQTAPARGSPAPRTVLRNRTAKRQQAVSEAGGDETLVVGRGRDAEALRF